MQNRARAGEGGQLPKGLSLFRFILFSCILSGAVYGGLSLFMNTPPPPGDVPPRGVPAAQWEPNPVWLPSWLALKLQLGVKHSAEGYVFPTRLSRAWFGSASVFFGMVLLGVLGWFGGEVIRKEAVRRRNL